MGKAAENCGNYKCSFRIPEQCAHLYDIFSEYTPIELILLEILLCTLICTFVGVLMFLFSLYINKIIAVAGGLALAIALFPVLNMHPLICYKLVPFCPTVWAGVSKNRNSRSYLLLVTVPVIYGSLPVSRDNYNDWSYHE